MLRFDDFFIEINNIYILGLKDQTQTTETNMISTETFNNATAFYHTTRPPPKRMLPQPSLPISQPVKR